MIKSSYEGAKVRTRGRRRRAVIFFSFRNLFFLEHTFEKYIYN